MRIAAKMPVRDCGEPSTAHTTGLPGPGTVPRVPHERIGGAAEQPLLDRRATSVAGHDELCARALGHAQHERRRILGFDHRLRDRDTAGRRLAEPLVDALARGGDLLFAVRSARWKARDRVHRHELRAQRMRHLLRDVDDVADALVEGEGEDHRLTNLHDSSARDPYARGLARKGRR
jgi:hypothetical protein